MSTMPTNVTTRATMFGFDPYGAILARLARHISVGHLRVAFPDGTVRVFGSEATPTPRADITFHRLRAVRRLITGGPNAFADAYLSGDWDSSDLTALLSFVLANEEDWYRQIRGLRIVRFADRFRHTLRTNSKRGSRRNIAAHYDLGNAFFSLWLDRSMTYSSAVFEHPEQTLENAQRTKFLRLARLLDLRPGHSVLEIGCGWGAFAELAAAEFGCHVHAITLSREQRDHAQRRIAAAGLSDRVTIALQDYRDVEGKFDRIASVEMFEAVGEAYWPIFFDVVRDRMRPDGVAGLQVITIDDRHFERYRRGADFIQRYVFPGGMLPSPGAFRRSMGDAGLSLDGAFTFGRDYARTLANWGRQFQDAWPRIRALGFDERFRRLWSFYLAYCEAGFNYGTIDVGQYRLVHA